MFDVGFFELLVIAVAGLVIIGPERLPSAIRTGALWWGRAKRSMRETRAELEKQIGADDIRRELHNEEVMRSLEALRRSSQELSEQGQSIEQRNNEAQLAVAAPAEQPRDDSPDAHSAERSKSS